MHLIGSITYFITMHDEYNNKFKWSKFCIMRERNKKEKNVEVKKERTK